MARPARATRPIDCIWCGDPTVDHTAQDRLYCARMARAWAKGQASHERASESTTARLPGTLVGWQHPCAAQDRKIINLYRAPCERCGAEPIKEEAS